MQSRYLAVQLWCVALDVGVAYPEILDVPMEFGLEFVPIIGSDFFDTEGELFDDGVYKIYRIGLRMLFVDI